MPQVLDDPIDVQDEIEQGTATLLIPNNPGPETQYVLDGLVQFGYTTGEIWPYIYVSDINANALIEGNNLSLNELSHKIMLDYLNWRKYNASIYQRLETSLSGTLQTKLYLNDFINSAFGETIEALVKSSNSICSHPSFFDIKDNFDLEKENELYSDKIVEQITKSKTFQEINHKLESLYTRLVEDLNACDSFKNYLEWRHNYIQKSRNVNSNESSNKIQNKQNKKKELKKTRKTLNRSIKFFEKLLGKKNLSVFLQGDGFTIQGKKFNYYIYKNENFSILKQTENPSNIHIPYNLEIYDKNNIYLARACIYFENTPILDQISAFYLHVSSGDEETMLKEMKILDASNNAKNCEFIGDKSPMNDTGLSNFLNDFETNYKNYLNNAYKEMFKQKLFNKMSVPHEFLEFIDNSNSFILDEITQNGKTDTISRLKQKFLSYENFANGTENIV